MVSRRLCVCPIRLGARLGQFFCGNVDGDFITILDQGYWSTMGRFGRHVTYGRASGAAAERPSVMRATDLSRPMPARADVGFSISACGPAAWAFVPDHHDVTGFIALLSIASTAASSESNTRATPVFLSMEGATALASQPRRQGRDFLS